MDTWEQLRRIKNHEEVAGSKLFQELFVKCPQAKILFGFPIDVDVHSPEVLSSKRFLMHASYLIQMIGTALNMLGPDSEVSFNSGLGALGCSVYLSFTLSFFCLPATHRNHARAGSQTHPLWGQTRDVSYVRSYCLY